MSDGQIYMLTVLALPDFFRFSANTFTLMLTIIQSRFCILLFLRVII